MSQILKAVRSDYYFNNFVGSNFNNLFNKLFFFLIFSLKQGVHYLLNVKFFKVLITSVFSQTYFKKIFLKTLLLVITLFFNFFLVVFLI